MSKKGVSESFSGQTTITSVKFGDQCCFVGEHAFQGCISLSEINDDNVLEYIGSNAFAQTNLKSAKFSNLSILYTGAFHTCSNLSYIDIPKCTSVSDGAFAACESLKDIEMTNVKKIGSEAFTDCSTLTSINIPNCSIISDAAFRNCNNLTTVINNSSNVGTTIGESAFYGCQQLNSINFKNIINIKQEAFKNCKSLDKINLNKCTRIGYGAFDGCENITEVTLSVCSAIETFAFANCPNLNKVYINNTSTFCRLQSPNVFCTCSDPQESNCSINTIFYFSADEYYKYISATHWSHYSKNMVMVSGNNQIIYISNNGKINVNVDGSNPIVEHIYNNYGLIEFLNPVKSLNQQMFKNSTNLISIDIPSECETIGESEFEGCTNLNSITLPSNTLTHIDKYAFKYCESLRSFEIPDSVENLGEGAFAGCKNINNFSGNRNFVTYNGKALVSKGVLICVLPKDDTDTEGRIHDTLLINANIYRLGDSCFHGCVNMRRINISQYINEIGDNVFEGCTNLCEIHFEADTPPTIGENAFKFENARPDLKIFVPEDSLEKYYSQWPEYGDMIYPKAKDTDIIYYGDRINNTHEYIDLSFVNGQYYKIPNTNTTLLTNHFMGNQSVKKVILGENISIINSAAFNNCKALEYVYLSDNITKFSDTCFGGCESLTRLHIPKGINSNTIGFDIFNGCTKLKEFGTYYKGYVSDDNRCYIDKNSTLIFFAQGDLSETEKSYEIPNNVIKIYRHAFKNSDINSITMGEYTTSIDMNAFEGCKNLQKIENWDNVETIGNHAFVNCSKLGGIALPNKLKTTNVYVFRECSEMYLTENIPNSVESIGTGTFYNCKNFKCVDSTENQIPLKLENITTINTQTFFGCTSLKQVNISNKITTIDYAAFENCTGLTSVSIPENSELQTINVNAFRECTLLKDLNLPNKLTYIGNFAFENCITYEGNYMSSMDQYILTIPQNVNTMGTACFKGSGIKELRVLESCNLTTLPNSAFENCPHLTSTKMLDAKNITTIGQMTFKNCIELCNLELPRSTKTIGDEAFNGCNKILNITLPSTLTKLGNLCFATGTTETKVYIPNGLKTPPSFTINGNIEPKPYVSSYPFGNTSLSYSEIPTIFVVGSLYNTYISNIHWSKYINKISVDPTVPVKSNTKISFANIFNGGIKNYKYGISVNGNNVYNVDENTSYGTLGTYEYEDERTVIAVVMAYNNSGKTLNFSVQWSSGDPNITATYSSDGGYKEVPNGAQGYAISVVLERKPNTFASGGVVINISPK